MSESVQALLALGTIIGLLGSVIVFMLDRAHWALLVGMPALLLSSFGLLLWSLMRRDKVPDLLRQIPGEAFERDGLCFKVVPRVAEGQCWLDLHFQTRFDRESQAMILLQPSRGFFLNRPDLGSMTVPVDCPPGGAGVVSLPWPVPTKFQGKKQSLDVAADVFYPEGRGKMIRYRGGIQVRAAGFSVWRAALTAAGALGGMIVLHSPAQLKLKLPRGVAETVSDDAPVTTQILWSLSPATDEPGSPALPVAG